MTMLEPTYETISLPTTPTPVSGAPEFRRDDEYFFDTLLFKVRTLVAPYLPRANAGHSFKIGDVGFRLPAYPFVQESDTFASQYDIRFDDGHENARAIELPDIEINDFKNFLKVLLPK